MKILTIYPIDNLFKKYGGIESFIQDVIKMAPPDLEYELVGITTEDQKIEVGKWHKIFFNKREIYFLPVLKVKDPNIRSSIPLFFRFTLALLRWRHKINFSNRLILLHRIEPAYVLTGIKEKKILFVHGNIKNLNIKLCESKWRRIRGLYYFTEHFFIKQMTKIFVVSNTGCEWYKRKYPKLAGRFEFFPMVYDSDAFFRMRDINKQDILQRYNIPNKKPIILFVGRLEMAKDPFLLLDSFFFITKTYPDAILVIVGGGLLKRKLIERIEKLNIVEKVILLGIKLRHEVAELMNISDVMLLTSAFEGMPHVVLEALACGLPVVSTNVGEVKLIIKDGISGKIVNSRKPEEIAREAINLISHPISAESCQKAVSQYSHIKIYNRLFDEIRRLKDASL